MMSHLTTISGWFLLIRFESFCRFHPLQIWPIRSNRNLCGFSSFLYLYSTTMVDTLSSGVDYSLWLCQPACFSRHKKTVYIWSIHCLITCINPEWLPRFLVYYRPIKVSCTRIRVETVSSFRSGYLIYHLETYNLLGLVLWGTLSSIRFGTF